MMGGWLPARGPLTIRPQQSQHHTHHAPHASRTTHRHTHLINLHAGIVLALQHLDRLTAPTDYAPHSTAGALQLDGLTQTVLCGWWCGVREGSQEGERWLSGQNCTSEQNPNTTRTPAPPPPPPKHTPAPRQRYAPSG